MTEATNKNVTEETVTDTTVTEETVTDVPVTDEEEAAQLEEFQKEVEQFGKDLKEAANPQDIMNDVQELRKNTAPAFEKYVVEAKTAAEEVVAKYSEQTELTEEEAVELQQAQSILSNIKEVEQQTTLQVIAFNERKPLEVTTSERLISNEMYRFYHFTRSRKISISSFEGVISRIVAHNKNHEMDSLLTFMYYIFKMFNQQTNEQREERMFYYRMTLGMVMASIFSSRRLSVVENFFKEYKDAIAK